MKSDSKTKKTRATQEELRKSAERKLERWKMMEQGDIRALIEITVDRGMATKEDFPDYFPVS